MLERAKSEMKLEGFRQKTIDQLVQSWMWATDDPDRREFIEMLAHALDIAPEVEEGIRLEEEVD